MTKLTTKKKSKNEKKTEKQDHPNVPSQVILNQKPVTVILPNNRNTTNETTNENKNSKSKTQNNQKVDYKNIFDINEPKFESNVVSKNPPQKVEPTEDSTPKKVWGNVPKNKESNKKNLKQIEKEEKEFRRMESIEQQRMEMLQEAEKKRNSVIWGTGSNNETNVTLSIKQIRQLEAKEKKIKEKEISKTQQTSPPPQNIGVWGNKPSPSNPPQILKKNPNNPTNVLPKPNNNNNNKNNKKTKPEEDDDELLWGNDLNNKNLTRNEFPSLKTKFNPLTTNLLEIVAPKQNNTTIKNPNSKNNKNNNNPNSKNPKNSKPKANNSNDVPSTKKKKKMIPVDPSLLLNF